MAASRRRPAALRADAWREALLYIARWAFSMLYAERFHCREMISLHVDDTMHFHASSAEIGLVFASLI